jgi:hypothetical protein
MWAAELNADDTACQMTDHTSFLLTIMRTVDKGCQILT